MTCRQRERSVTQRWLVRPRQVSSASGGGPDPTEIVHEAGPGPTAAACGVPLRPGTVTQLQPRHQDGRMSQRPARFCRNYGAEACVLCTTLRPRTCMPASQREPAGHGGGEDCEHARKGAQRNLCQLTKLTASPLSPGSPTAGRRTLSDARADAPAPGGHIVRRRPGQGGREAIAYRTFPIPPYRTRRQREKERCLWDPGSPWFPDYLLEHLGTARCPDHQTAASPRLSTNMTFTGALKSRSPCMPC
jgi:hypothetical protein